MTLPLSGALALSAIQTEFGGSSPTSISEYYGSDSSVGVPTSGPIAFSDFYGAKLFEVVFNAASYAPVHNAGRISFTMAFTGSISYTNGIGTWATRSGSEVSDYEVSISGSGDSPTSGLSLATWYSLGTPRSWIWDDGGGSDLLFSGTITIRDIATQTTQGTATLTIDTSGAGD